jgi:hypothetical protein
MDPDLRRHIAEISREHDRMMARERDTAGSPQANETGPAGIVRKLFDNEPAVAATAVVDDENARNSAGWNSWIQGHIEAEREAEREVIARAMGEVCDAAIATVQQEFAESIEDRDRKFVNEYLRHAAIAEHAEMAATALGHRVAQLEREVAELRAGERIRSERSAEIARVTKDADAGRFNLQQRTIERELAARDGRISTLEAQLAMLLKFLSLQGYDLPDGL